MKKFFKSIAAITGAVMTALVIVSGYYSNVLPDSYLVSQGNRLSIGSFFEISCTPQETELQVISNQNEDNLKSYTANLTLFGKIPIKTVAVEEVERPVLVAGGNPFGIKMHTEGVIVVDFESIVCGDKLKCPAKDSGLKVGDIIVSVDGIKITSNGSLSEVISSSKGKELDVTVMRDENKIELDICAVFCTDDDTFKAGIYTRDSSAGIGTLTFYDPSTSEFAGLGHAVCDSDTGDILPLSSGEVVSVSINGFNKGERGKPGELLGSFTSTFSSGKLEKNCKYGVYGSLSYAPNLSAPIMLGYKQEAQLGSAKMLTTIDGSSPCEYDIEIEKIDYTSDGTKNMIIKVTDEKLLQKTGGILQGMSGSPIIQNDMLVGAVTHVFVNDPTRGYAIFAETMYSQLQ